MDKAQTAAANEDAAEEAKRGRSKISFVYNDLEAAIGLATTLNSRAGTTCSTKQLATWMNQSVDGGTFRSIVGAAKTFGLIETGQGSISLTSLGLHALDAARRPAALAEAFLKVPLHLAMYEQYEGHALPPPAAIERQMETLGVPPKQKERARQTFSKSATFAGFIDPPTGRFVRPATDTPPVPNDRDRKPKPPGGGGGDGGLHLDGLLMELLRKIPPVEEGWPKESRLRWFRTFAMNVSQIYDTGDEVVDLTIKLGSGEQQ
jgi:hypothetical protein